MPRSHNIRRVASRVLWVVVYATLAVAFDCVSAAPAADKPAEKKTERPDLDDALLNDLDNDLLEGAGDLRDNPKSKSNPQPKSTDDQQPDARHPGLPARDGEDIGMPGEDEDPLVRISQQMRSAESLIPEQGRRSQAADMQQRVVVDLNKLIEQAEKQASQQPSSQSKGKKQQGTSRRQTVQQPKQQQQKQGGQTGKDSSKPAQDSTDRLGKAEPARPDPEMMKGLMKNSWGHLPPKAKEQMMQTSPERFLPQYELMIEKYYKRLAEEQSSK